MALSEAEEVEFFGLCVMDESDGFLVVTNRRAAFLAQRPRKLLEWPLEHLRDVEIRGRGRRACIQMRGEAGHVTLRHFDSKSALRQVAATLSVPRLPR
jgi:hypothetical protein